MKNRKFKAPLVQHWFKRLQKACVKSAFIKLFLQARNAYPLPQWDSKSQQCANFSFVVRKTNKNFSKNEKQFWQKSMLKLSRWTSKTKIKFSNSFENAFFESMLLRWRCFLTANTNQTRLDFQFSRNHFFNGSVFELEVSYLN